MTGAGKGRGGSGETAMCACRAERLGLYYKHYVADFT